MQRAAFGRDIGVADRTRFEERPAFDCGLGFEQFEREIRLFAVLLGLVARLLRQRREDRGRDKLYSLHAPEVECIGKGKAQARYEFGCKVSIATINAAAPGGQFVLGARALPGNPYDGHTLAAQTERITGVEIERA